MLSEFQSLYGEGRAGAGVLAKQTAAYSTALQTAVAESQGRLKRALDRAKADGGAAAAAAEAARAVDDQRSRLRELARTDRKSGLAVELVLISALCGLNQRFLKMETVAKSELEPLENFTDRQMRCTIKFENTSGRRIIWKNLNRNYT